MRTKLEIVKAATAAAAAVQEGADLLRNVARRAHRHSIVQPMLLLGLLAFCAGAGAGSLGPGQRLNPGQSVWSDWGQYQFIMQTDGNLVLYTQGRPLWNTGTQGYRGAFVVMQTDGNLVVYSSSGRALWRSGTAGRGLCSLYIQNDANLVIYNSRWQPVWASNTRNPILAAGEGLTQNQRLYSPGKDSFLAMQSDGNLVVYRDGAPVWAAGTQGHSGAFVVMQRDGNLVVYDRYGRALWASNTCGWGSSLLVLHDRGCLTVLTTWGHPTWVTRGDDYPSYLRNARMNSLFDPWGFYNRNCTSEVAYRMNRDGGDGTFWNTMGGRRWGNAYNWAQNARALGYPVNGTPTVGSIAWFSIGHVAYVCAVYGDGSVDVEEYNYSNPGGYGVRHTRANAYIHIHG